jgi:uncharacterized membrane protein (DUF2068 family)
MEAVKWIRLLAASLLMFTGVVHLAMSVSALESMTGQGAALFGVLYVILAIGLFAGRRFFNYLGAVITTVGLIVGIYTYVAMTPELLILPLAAIDVIIIVCCCYLILHKTK